MNNDKLQLLVVDDDEDDYLLVRDLLTTALDAQVERAASADQALQCLAVSSYDALLLDYRLGAASGLDLLPQLRSRHPAAPVIFLTGHGDEQVAVAAMKAGATDYLSKSKLSPPALALAVRYAVNLRRQQDAVQAARRALQVSEQRFRALVENGSDIITLLDAEASVLYSSHSARRLLGWSPAELVDTSAFAHVHPNDAPRLRQLFPRLLEAPGVPFRFQHRSLHKDGHYVVLESTAVNRLHDDAVRALVLNSRDVTDRCRAQQEICRLNRALKALSKCNQALLHATDRQQLLREICQIVVEVGGYRMAWVAVPHGSLVTSRCSLPDQRPATSDHLDHWFTPLVGAGHVDGYFQVLDRLGAQGRARLPIAVALFAGEPNVCRDIATDERFAAVRPECLQRGYASALSLPLTLEGRRFGALAIYSAERDAFDVAEVDLLGELAANLSYGLTALHAQAERARAAEALSASEQRYRSLVSATAQIVWTCDAQGEATGDSTTWADFTGQTREQMQGWGWLDVVHPEDRERVEPACREAFTRLEPYETEYRLRRQDGEYRYVCERGVPVLQPGSGAVREWVGACTDITERRNLQEQLLHSQKLEAVGQLAGGVAHDFNNLLMVVGSHAELLLGLTADPAARGKAQEIVDAVRRGASLTRQLLAFSRKQLLSPSLLNLNHTLAQLGPALPRMLGEKVLVELQPAPGLWPVKADPAQIEQVIINLAVNARDAMPQGGRLTLETANVELSSDYARTHAGVQPGQYVMLAVSDSGEGIPRYVLPHIFEPFFTTKEPGQGTGLGLPTVYGIVQQSGGFIWVYSEPGQGTVFKIYLPKVDAPLSESRDASPEPRVPSPEPRAGTRDPELATILLVEDEEAVRAAVREFLSRRGYRVLEAAAGQEALGLADSFAGQIHLVISDVVMPGISGSEMARRLHALRPDTRVLFVSGYTEATVGDHGLDPAAEFLQKPFSLTALAARIEQLLAPVQPAASSK